MSNEVAVRNETAVAIPADLAALFGGVKANVATIDRVNTLRISGKVWKVDIDGEQKKLTTVVEGEEIPVPMVKVIIVNQNPKRARALFEGAFEEGASVAPVCWSSDSAHPDKEVQQPKASSCEQCTESQKKTKFDENNPDKVIEFVPCKFNKRIAVVQHNRPDSPALRLQLAVSSLWEPKDTAKSKELQGWFAYDNYTRALANKGITNTAMCRTIMKFDPDATGVKILFKFDGLIDAATAAVIVPRIESDEVYKCLGIKKGNDGAEPVKQIEAPKQPKPAAPVQEPETFTEPEQVAQVEQPAPAPKVEKPKAPKKPVQVVEEAEVTEDLLSLAWD